MFKQLVFFLFFTHIVSAHGPIPKLLDSLARTTSESEKANLSLVIASELAGDDWIRAVNYIHFAERSAKATKLDSVIADTHTRIAHIYASKDAFDISLEHYLKSYHYYEGKIHPKRYRLENDLAVTYFQTQNPDKALEFFQKVLNSEHANLSTVESAAVANNIGLVWMEKDLDSATFYFNKSLELIREIEKPTLKVMLYTNLARTAASKEDDPQAKRLFKLAINES